VAPRIFLTMHHRGNGSSASDYSESAVNLLMSVRSNSMEKSERPLTSFMFLAAFDSTIRRFDPSRPSQKLSGKINRVSPNYQAFPQVTKAISLPEISIRFQCFPKTAGNSTRHGCDMVSCPHVDVPTILRPRFLWAVRAADQFYESNECRLRAFLDPYRTACSAST
jgi:hypothetical protein